MTNEKEFKIPLDSPLDVNKGDQLVNVTEPLFSYNRQKYLGGLLQTSVRYEDDGYFAGWWKHQFELISTGENLITPPYSSSAQEEANNLVIHNKKTNNGIPFFVVQEKSVGLNMTVAPETWNEWFTGEGTITRLENAQSQYVDIQGTTELGLSFQVRVDIYNVVIESSTLPESFYAKVDKIDEAIILIVDRILVPNNDWFVLRKNEPLIIDDGLLNYEVEGDKSIWGSTIDKPDGEFSLDHTTQVVTATADSEFEIQTTVENPTGCTLFDEGLETERVNFVVSDKTEASLVSSLEFNELWSKVRFENSLAISELIGGSSVDDSINSQQVSMLDIQNNSSENAYIDVSHSVPLWLAIYSRSLKFRIDTASSSWTFKMIQPAVTAAMSIHGSALSQDACSVDWRVFTNIQDPWTTEDISESLQDNESFVLQIRYRNNSSSFKAVAIGDEICIVSLEFKRPENILGVISTNTDVYNFLFNSQVTFSEYSGFKALNRLRIHGDEKLFEFLRVEGSDSIYALNVPICFYGYSFYRLSTEDIIQSNISAFKVAELSNEEAQQSEQLIRVDSLGLQIATPVLSGISSGNTLNEQKIIVSLEAEQDIKPLYALKKELSTTDLSTSELESSKLGDSMLNTGVYPEWVIDVFEGLVNNSMFLSNEYLYPFFPSRNTNTASQISSNIDIQKYIDQISFDPQYILSDYNSSLFNNIAASFRVTAYSEDRADSRVAIAPTSGIFKYVLDIVLQGSFDRFDTIDYISFDYDVYTGFSIRNESKSTNFSILTDKNTVPSLLDAVQRIEVFLLSKKTFILSAKRSFVQNRHGFVLEEAPSLRIVSQLDDVVTLSDDYGSVDLAAYVLSNSDVVSFINAVKTHELAHTYYVAENNSANVKFIVQGITHVMSDNIVYNSMTEDSNFYYVSYTDSAVARVLQIDKKSRLNLYYDTKDIRNNDDEKFVYQNDLTGIKMFIKQQWSDDTNVENYWWIDDSHILELTAEEIILKEKTSDLDDWNGDKWVVATETYLLDGVEYTKEKRVPRQNFFGIQDVYYNVSCAKNSLKGPVLFKIQVSSNSSISILYIDDIKECIFDLMSSDFDLKPSFLEDDKYWKKITIDVLTVPFGSALSTRAISSYVELDAAAIISSSSISSTIIDGVLMIGFAYSKGLKQWTVKINSQSSYDIINGYGHVGLNGSLTGGQIPSSACSDLGFNAAVQDISNLESVEGLDVTNQSQSTPSTPPSTCYGTGSTVWFINKSISSIVSHLEYEPTTKRHTTVEIALRNMVERRYESSSFQANGLFDVFSPPLSFTTLFQELFSVSPGLKIVSDILLPVLFYVDLKYIMLSYINHSFGQYAYVWRNASRDYMPDGKTDQDVSFLQDKYTQTFSQNADSTNAWVQIILKAVEFADNLAIEYKVNQSQNQMTSDDSVGRKFSQFFTENVTNTVDDIMLSQGFNISLKSTLAQAYTLDMFYSISDNSQCFAGPGFVNHNFIGQCVAQSVTDTQLVGKRVGYWVTLKALSEIIISFKIKLLEAAKNALDSLSEAAGSSVIPVTVLGSGTGIPVGLILSTALNVASTIMDSTITLNVEGLKILEQLAKAIGPDTGKAYDAGNLKKYNLSIEGTHTYGNKPMNFFWPAFGIKNRVSYTNEWVTAEGESNEQDVSFTGKNQKVFFNKQESWTSSYSNDSFLSSSNGLPMQGAIKTVTVKCKGVSVEQKAPENTAVVEGAKTFLSPVLFKNEQIGVSPATFPPPAIHDYMIDESWLLGYTAGAGEVIWLSCDDTKVLDGPASNIVVTEDFCGVASSYTAIEIKKEYDHDYLRPWAVTPQAIALNINKMNCVQEQKVFHAFDGQGNRIVKWAGGSGMDKAVLYQQYQFQVNDHFKRSNILPPSQFFGIFEGPPSSAMSCLSPEENVVNLVQALSKQQIPEEVPGEQKDLARFSIPVHSSQLSTLPAMVRMLAPYKLLVVEGITSLCTEIRSTQTRFKAPTSIDFNIYSQAYRATEEYLCEIKTEGGVVAVKDICATAGLKYIGATTKEAFFYSPATRLYYAFKNGREIEKVDITNRFTSLEEGKWDYVNQEVILKVLKDDETMIVRLDENMLGEVFPPNTTLYSDESNFKVLSMAGGLVYQGPRRFSVNRFVILDHMFEDIKLNNWRKENALYPEEFGKKNWRRVSRLEYDQERNYGWSYRDYKTLNVSLPIYDEKILDQGLIWWAVRGWTHNPKGLVTSMLGLSDRTDCKFEWLLTFAWTEQIDKFFANDEYATVNIRAETICQGGVVVSEITQVFLFKECFTKNGSAGYYTFKFQSNNGAGNRERLYLWSDAIVALQDLRLSCKEITSQRTQVLNTQVDVQSLTEI